MIVRLMIWQNFIYAYWIGPMKLGRELKIIFFRIFKKFRDTLKSIKAA